MGNSNKTIMVLPGTMWQLQLMKKVKSLGYKLAVVHPVEGTPGFELADYKVLEDILDKDAVLAAAKRYNVCAVMSDECDIATPTLAYVSSKLGLPSQTEAMAQLYTDKSLMRDFCKEHRLPYPEYKVCENFEDALLFFRQLGKKMIIKPIDANSSRGVYSIYTEEDLKAHFEESICYSHHRHAVICERYITGTEFSVDGIRLPQGHVCLAISEKQQFAYNQNLDESLYFSYDNPKFNYDRMREIDNAFVEASNLPFGFTHAEYKYEDGEFYLLEIGARGGGVSISSHIVPAMTGLDNYQLLIDMFVGNPINTKIDVLALKTNKVAVLQFFDTTEKGGRVKDIKGLDYLANESHILFYKLNFGIGDEIHRPTDGGNRIGFYVAWAESREAMAKLQQDINANFEIIYE